MRYLSKIIFINSAHVPYAEVKLDGNVHFIGTQGVGKSTLLRAILFFYNADKLKLGIKTQDKQKSYDDFYLPYPNSYIIYEVTRENGKFFVMSFKTSGRAAFRIVDCPYSRDFFLEEDGEVRYEWGKISTAIGAEVFKSNIIKNYEQFRDIIYGNFRNLDKELCRFNLMESPRYQNVPRTIQNIFLNQSLESRVIKDTIIDSMDFSGDGIDLNFYRDHVKNFRQQYEDIWKWFKPGKQGKIKVREDASKVIDRYSIYEGCRQTVAELCGNLKYALQRDADEIPKIEKKEAADRHELQRRQRLLGEEEGKFRAQADKLAAEEGAIKAFLETVASKKTHYATIGIEDIAERVGKEKSLKTERESLERSRNLLMDKHHDVKSRYDAMEKDVYAGLREFKLSVREEISGADREANEEINKLNAELAEKKELEETRFRSLREELEVQTETAMQQRNDLRVREAGVAHLNPYKPEIEEQSAKLETLKARQASLEKSALKKESEIAEITSEVALARKDLERACDSDVTRLLNEADAARKELAQLDSLLEKQEGSLIQWLDKNVKNWENGIGKILDEESVLYNSALEPKKVDDSGTVFGVSINIDNIERKINTPEALRKRKEEVEEKIAELENDAKKRRQKLADDIYEMEQKPNQRLKTLRKEEMDIKADMRLNPQLIENVKKSLARYEDDLKAFRQKERDELHRLLYEVDSTLSELRKKRDNLSAERDKTMSAISKEGDKRRFAILSKRDGRRKELNESIAAKEKEADAKKAEILRMMDAELKGLNVDTDKLNEIRRNIEAVDRELDFIDRNRNEYVGWLNDKRDYFAQEQPKRDQLKEVKKKIDTLRQKFDERKSKLVADIAELSESVKSASNLRSRLSEEVAKGTSFVESVHCPAEYAGAMPLNTVQKLDAIREELTFKLNDRQKHLEAFRSAVVAFKNNFSAQNTFHFRTEFYTEGDLVEFAVELSDFISNNKIEEYRVRTSSQYATIIRRMAKEVGDLDRHNADIRDTINKINRDFLKNNFAGVIKGIELRAVESNDRLMQHLLSIKKFDDDNSMSIGELNLFSDFDNTTNVNKRAIELLMSFVDKLEVEQKRERITLSDTFKLEFKVRENDNDTNWVEKLSNVGSDGTDILVKAMVNIMLINVFKHKISRKFGDFKLHCMMDEIGKLHPTNVEGILRFANVRNIILINSSPTTYNASAYKYTYFLSKDDKSNTRVEILLTIK